MELLQIIICLVRIPVISTTSMAGKSLLRCQVKEIVIHFYKKARGKNGTKPIFRWPDSCRRSSWYPDRRKKSSEKDLIRRISPEWGLSPGVTDGRTDITEDRMKGQKRLLKVKVCILRLTQWKFWQHNSCPLVQFLYLEKITYDKS